MFAESVAVRTGLKVPGCEAEPRTLPFESTIGVLACRTQTSIPSAVSWPIISSSLPNPRAPKASVHDTAGLLILGVAGPGAQRRLHGAPRHCAQLGHTHVSASLPREESDMDVRSLRVHGRQSMLTAS